MPPHNDGLESFGIYKIACQLFDDFWGDSETLGQDYRGRELVKQQSGLDFSCHPSLAPCHFHSGGQ